MLTTTTATSGCSTHRTRTSSAPPSPSANPGPTTVSAGGASATARATLVPGTARCTSAPGQAIATLAPSASDRDGSSSQIKMRIASTSVAGERPYGAPAADASVPRRIRSEYAGTAPSGGGARLGVGTGPPSQRLCAGTPRSPGPAGAAGAAEAERAAPSPRRGPLDFRRVRY